MQSNIKIKSFLIGFFFKVIFLIKTTLICGNNKTGLGFRNLQNCVGVSIRWAGLGPTNYSQIGPQANDKVYNEMNWASSKHKARII